MNTIRIRALRNAIFAFSILCGAATAAQAPQYLSTEIEAALASRTEFLRRAGLTDGDFLNLGQWLEQNDRDNFASRLESLSDGENPWYYFLYGFLETDAENADTYCGYAIDAASPDLGALWLLALEFIRNDRQPKAADALTELERQLFVLGGSSAPLLARQLMLFGNILAPQYPKDAAFCYTWSERFDNTQRWWLYKKAALDPPNNLASGIPAFIAGASEAVGSSWRAQLAFVRELYRFVSTALFIFMCAAILAFMLKYLPDGAHTMGDWLFHGASPRFRTISSVIIVLSILPLGIAPFYGLIPFLWAGVFMIRRFLTAPEKKILTLACVILAASPLDAVATNFLRRQSAPDSTPAVFDRVVTEGFSSGLHELAAANAVKKPHSSTDQLALAMSYAKNGDHGQSAEYLRRAEELAPSDPMVLMYAGYISYLAGNIEAVERYYSRLLEEQPHNAAARYNYAQSLIGKGGFIASDAVAEAVKIDPSLVSEFVRVNERYFGEDIPPLRKLIQTAVTPGYFWGHLFFADFGGGLKVRGWPLFFGLGPLAAFALFAALLTALLALDVTVWSNRSRVKKFFTCRICGRLLCRRCRKGTMCSSCYRLCVTSQNNAAEMYNRQKKCRDRAQLRKDMFKCLIGMFVPGAGRLYAGEQVFRPAAALLVTGAVLAAYYCAFTFRADYPSLTVINPLYYVSIFLLYNIAAFFRQGAAAAKVLRDYAKKSKGGG